MRKKHLLMIAVCIVLVLGAAELWTAFSCFLRWPLPCHPVRVSAPQVDSVIVTWDGGVDAVLGRALHRVRIDSPSDVELLCQSFSSACLREAPPSVPAQRLTEAGDELDIEFRLKNGRRVKVALGNGLLLREYHTIFATDDESIIYKCDNEALRAQLVEIAEAYTASQISLAEQADSRPSIYLMKGDYHEK